VQQRAGLSPFIAAAGLALAGPPTA